MTTLNWQLQTPIDAILFDCDGTLSALEGIDELAKKNGVGNIVQHLTETAMGKSGINLDLYQKRLDLVRPSQQQVITLGTEYFMHCIPDAVTLIPLLQQLNKKIYILSAGLYPAVVIFGKLLHIPQKNIFAVDIQFDRYGHFLDFDRTSPLIQRDGKRAIVNQLKIQHPRILYLGDGLNDYATQDLVTRFVGYGGTFYRENIASCCEYYIKIPSLAPLLALGLTPDEHKRLTPSQLALYQKGLQAIHDGNVLTCFQR